MHPALSTFEATMSRFKTQFSYWEADKHIHRGKKKCKSQLNWTLEVQIRTRYGL